MACSLVASDLRLETKFPSSSLAASYVQMWAIYSHLPANA